MLLSTFSLLLLLPLTSAQTAPLTAVVTVTAPLVDIWCMDDNNGIALDTRDNLWDDPYSHTVHCLVEVSFCRNSGFVMMHKPDGDSQWSVQYTLDDAANAQAIEEMWQISPSQRGYDFTYTGIDDGNTDGWQGSTLLRTIETIITENPSAMPTVTPTSATVPTITRISENPSTIPTMMPSSRPSAQSESPTTAGTIEPSVNGSCLVGDIEYSNGDLIGQVGNTCVSIFSYTPNAYTGTRSYCDNGAIREEEFSGDCEAENEFGFVCCQQGAEGSYGGAVCVTEENCEPYSPTTTQNPSQSGLDRVTVVYALWFACIACFLVQLM